MAVGADTRHRREARERILSDELVQKLVPVGQVDILVGVPTFNNAATVESVITKLHVGLAKHFPRERTVLINPDGGSDDGTTDRVLGAPMADEEMRGSTTLRTTHRVSARYSGTPGAATGIRAVFAAADLLQARVVVVIDPEVTTMTPDWVADLARPVWTNEADLVVPVHPRGRFDGPLISQLLRPLLGTAYGRRLHATFGGEFSCSGPFAASMVSRPIWDNHLFLPSLDIWLVTSALAEARRLREVYLGARSFSSNATLTAIFEHVFGTALHCLERHGDVWPARSELVEVPPLGSAYPSTDAESAIDLTGMSDRFRSGVPHLEPLLREIMSEQTLARLMAAAPSDGSVPLIPDPLWVSTVFEFAAAVRRGVMNREHLTQALIPAYLGRTASFFAELVGADVADYPARLAQLEQEFARQRPYLVELWNANGKR